MAGLLARRQALEIFYKGNHDVDSLGPSKGDSEPRLFSQLLTPVTVFLESLFQKKYIDQIKRYSTVLWNKLKTCYVNFSHFSEDFAHKEFYKSLTTEGLLTHFVRGSAIKCHQVQTGIDMVIPMAVLSSESMFNKPVSISDISALIIQVKNIQDDKGSFTSEFIDKAQFDIRHISGLSEGSIDPFYVGIWMSLRDPRNDFRLESSDILAFGTSTVYYYIHLHRFYR